ncbi:hypothetical protein I317_02766 [Kwoniella heveanensis CBS 569]|nr:hypothetical protein I317_02766 [Kwoniella heveanensis CBS 569]
MSALAASSALAATTAGSLIGRAGSHPEYQVTIKKPEGPLMSDFIAQRVLLSCCLSRLYSDGCSTGLDSTAGFKIRWTNQCTHAKAGGCEKYTEKIDEEIVVVYCICPLDGGLWDDKTDKYIQQFEATKI